jgi:hypothetical protein
MSFQYHAKPTDYRAHRSPLATRRDGRPERLALACWRVLAGFAAVVIGCTTAYSTIETARLVEWVIGR